ncbi:MAG: TolC family protein, partial [Planctomycetes bacterium]|nr:TolC family protein [Planctomycetota bacterium]
TLFADVARNYVDVRAFQARLDYAEANVLIQRETLQLTQNRFDAGLVSSLDVAQAESNLASSEAAIPRLETSLATALNRLAVLLGSPRRARCWLPFGGIGWVDSRDGARASRPTARWIRECVDLRLEAALESSGPDQRPSEARHGGEPRAPRSRARPHGAAL